MNAPAIRSKTRVFCDYDSQYNVDLIEEGVYGLINLTVKEGKNRGKPQLQYRLSGANMKGAQSGRFPGRWVDWHERIRGTGEATFASKSGQLRVWVTNATTDFLAEILDESIDRYMEQYREKVGRLHTPEARFITLISRCTWCSHDPEAVYFVTAKRPGALNVQRLPLRPQLDMDAEGNVLLDSLVNTPLNADALAAVLALSEQRNALDTQNCHQYLNDQVPDYETLRAKAELLLNSGCQIKPARDLWHDQNVPFRVDTENQVIYLEHIR